MVRPGCPTSRAGSERSVPTVVTRWNHVALGGDDGTAFVPSSKDSEETARVSSSATLYTFRCLAGGGCDMQEGDEMSLISSGRGISEYRSATVTPYGPSYPCQLSPLTVCAPCIFTVGGNCELPFSSDRTDCPPWA
ncbi:hypothetical protein DAEQUDRAFT_267183 [Daedalea quercina L-15889]|uniref:Uncharacterized protein n=1 Tax=Daedalea quercina L-15889 TaxID=1314783 RepID=A0A165QH03_9APHY|nr:hypothetical protein DAEQUDRAFT_267183 [Daedalea quercina L-15889]